MLSVERIDDQIELAVGRDDGIGIAGKGSDKDSGEARAPTMWRSSCASLAARSLQRDRKKVGTTVRVRLPFLLSPPEGTEARRRA